ncbi:MAG: hypothetical protein ABIO94_12520 [Opitutaceae bacterium]
MKYAAILLITVTLALANTVNRAPLPSPPPKGKEVASFANTPPTFGRRIVITREQLVAFLDRGEVHSYLPQLLGERLEKTRLGRTSSSGGTFSLTSETLVVCEGAFSDSKQNMYFWRLLAPEFLSITDEQGRGCFIYLSPSPIAEPNQSLQPTAPSGRG